MNDRDQRDRLVKALLAAALIGVAELGLVRYVLLPRLVQGLTPNQLQWLRGVFVTHTAWFMLAILALAAVLGLPVLIVALRTARLGPWRYGSAGTGESDKRRSQSRRIL
jgi:hypothetical protein